MGVAKKSLGNYTDARKYLERALRIDPRNPDVIRQMVMHHDKVVSLLGGLRNHLGNIFVIRVTYPQATMDSAFCRVYQGFGQT